MVDSLLRCVVSHPNMSALPQDTIINTFHFRVTTASPFGAEISDIDDGLEYFWESLSGAQVNPINSYLSSALDHSEDMLFTYYAKLVGAADFGPPVAVSAHPFATAQGAPSLPNEVALAVSFHGDLSAVGEFGSGGTRPRARRRGRVFIGPLWDGTSASSSGNPARPSATFMEDLRLAADRLMILSDDATTWKWVVPHAAESAGWTSVPVIGGWVDNEFDTQRRRGLVATTRSTFAL